MLGLGLRQLQETLDRKADKVQREFLRLSEELSEVNAALMEVKGEGRQPLVEQQKRLRERQLEVADEINVWRERARSVTQSAGERSLRALLEELRQVEDEEIQSAVERTLQIIDAPEEALEAMRKQEEDQEQRTPVGRLIERGRTEYELRLADPAARRRAAAEFANRPGMAQEEPVFEELQQATRDPDPMVHELVMLTLIQLHRFRAMRVADLDLAHNSVVALTKMKTPEVIPALVEVLQNPRTGFTQAEGAEEMVEAPNTDTRMAALIQLVEWRTPEAKAAVESVRFDKDAKIARAAERALEVFSGPWTGQGREGEPPQPSA